MQIDSIKKPIGLFFYKKQIIAITYDKGDTILYTHDAFEIKHHITYVLNALLMAYLHTFEGYLKAFKHMYKKQSLTPIILHESCVLLPMYGYKNDHNVMINIYEIKSLRTSQKGCLVMMKNGQAFDVFKSCRTIKKQIEMTIRIHDFFK
jgi:competence transcription factor ComK